MWDKYSVVFSGVWVATAFKGATGSCQHIPIIQHHISNHERWLEELSTHVSKLCGFRGTAFTGWSRQVPPDSYYSILNLYIEVQKKIICSLNINMFQVRSLRYNVRAFAHGYTVSGDVFEGLVARIFGRKSYGSRQELGVH